MVIVDKGKVLFVDLTEGSIKEEKLGEKRYRDFIGGAGLGLRISYERMKAKIDPLGPDNLLGFVTGLLTGSPVPSACRYMIVAKSPLTGTWGDSNSGGYFGHELRVTGYSAVFFSGISPKPVYLWLHNNKAELRDAAHLWGKETYETEEILRQELSDQRVRVACIGPSGECLSLLACVMNDGGDAAGRSGLGAVMGSKHLKAIAVRGTGNVPVADSERLNALRKGIIKDILSNKTFETRRTYGTIDLNTVGIISGASPIKNWSLNGSENFPNYMKLDQGEVIKYQSRRHSCWGCPLACKGTFRVAKGPYAIEKTEKTEYETFCGFGPMCLNDDVESIIKAGDICNRYGIDTISTSTTIAFAMECYERGIISNKETDGVELTWGNALAMLATLDKVVRREGFGAVLADGVKRAAERIGRGSQKYAIHIHGQEPGYHDPRFHPARGTFYLCDPTPGRHTTSPLTIMAEVGKALGPYPELTFPKLDPLDYQAKGPIYATGSSYYQLINACGLCSTPLKSGNFPVADCISAVTGWDFTMTEGLRAGWRIQTLRQAFNLREGLRPADFSLPQRISEPTITGPFAGRAIDFDALRQNFYAAMGWDTSGWPSELTLRELGLDSLIYTGRGKE